LRTERPCKMAGLFLCVYCTPILLPPLDYVIATACRPHNDKATCIGNGISGENPKGFNMKRARENNL
ncbi:MAG: hypothetical protein JXB29_04320, partial [Sedimentisphaerales bacterium]|nr:hypothetical protein [Sedimentisphaerales bacterium]